MCWRGCSVEGATHAIRISAKIGAGKVWGAPRVNYSVFGTPDKVYYRALIHCK
jgi:hypothetical protein